MTNRAIPKNKQEGIMTDIEKQINLVVEARADAKAYSVEQSRIYEEVEEKNASLFADAFNSKEILKEAEAELRQMAIDSYAETGNKQVAQGIVIKVGTSIEYSKDDAMAWAMDHKLALQLDVKAFEEMAKVSPNGFGFVEISPEPKATIATELQVIE